MEWTDWTQAWVQVHVCEKCGEGGCEPGNYIQLFRLDEHVLWTPPGIDPDDEVERVQYRPMALMERDGNLLFRADQWRQWRELYPQLRAIISLDYPRRSDLARMWLIEIPAMFRSHSLAGVREVLEKHAYCGSTMALEEIASILVRIIAWFEADPKAVLRGDVCLARALNLQQEVVYLDAAGVPEWAPFACRDNEVYLAFGSQWVLNQPLA